MVLINNETRELTIKVDGDTGDLVGLQNALIDLMQCYNFDVFGNGAGSSFFYALKLLQSSLPDEDQQHKGFITESNYLLIPKGITEKQTEQLKSAMFEVTNPGALKNLQKNPIIEALRNIEK